jgi:predicted TIM-barrel fold metal-dependent hydrolase
MNPTHRRAVLSSASSAGLAAAAPPPIPIIDCHIHLFDQTRPQGAPYSAAPRNTTPALQPRYRRLAGPLDIAGAIIVEASPWIEDNLWALQIAQSDPLILGLIGNLQPEKPEFREYLDRHHRNPLFLGIRYGNLWNYSLVHQLANPVFLAGLKLLHQAGLTLDTANPQPDLLQAVLRLTTLVPGLRIVVDHLPALLFRLDPSTLQPTLRELAQCPSVFIKVSAALRTANGRAITDPALYKPVFDAISETFSPANLIFGSDWPNSVAVDNLPAIVQIARHYFQSKPTPTAENFFWKNSLTAYRWSPRHPSQPTAPSGFQRR